jgi:general stress protein YciG
MISIEITSPKVACPLFRRPQRGLFVASGRGSCRVLTVGQSGNQAVMTKERTMAGNEGGSKRGFASMDEEKQRKIASEGGKSVPDEKRSFSQDPELAAEAGRKGGESVPAEKRSFSQDPELAAEAGRKGGESVPAEKRSFSQDPELAREAGRKGGESSGGGNRRE